MRSAIGWSALSRDGDTDRDADRGDAETLAGRGADRGSDALADLERDVRARVAQQDDELLAAVPGRDVVLADRRDDRATDRAEHLVAGRVAVRVVEHLELVDVDHQDADRVAGATAARQERRRTRRSSGGSGGRSARRSTALASAARCE